MNSGSQGLSFHQDMALMQMCAGKEEIFSLPVWKEKLTSVKSTPSKGENRLAKRKLYSSGSASEDEDKNTAILKRRRNSPVGDLSPTTGLHPKPRTPTNAQRLNTVPLSERQQMALLMRQITDESHHGNADALPHCGTPKSPFSSTNKKTPTSDCKYYKRNNRGETSLHIAAMKGDVKSVKKLIETGMDVNIRDYAGWTPLHEACNFGKADVVRCLLRAGANVNVQGLDNDLPLHDAARNGHAKIVELLLRHGANPLLQNLKGSSSLDVAKEDEIIKLMNGEVLASGSSCSSSSINDVRSPASLDSCLPDHDEERIRPKKDGRLLPDATKLQVAAPAGPVAHWDKLLDGDLNLPRTHSYVPNNSCSNQQVYELLSTKNITPCTRQDVSQWSIPQKQTLNYKQSYQLASYPEKPCAPLQHPRSFFNSMETALKAQEAAIMNELYAEGKLQLTKNAAAAASNWKSSNVSDSGKDGVCFPFQADFPNLMVPPHQQPTFVSTSNLVKSDVAVQVASSSSSSNENSKSFVTQFEDISDAEDDETKVAEDPMSKLKSNFLVSNLQHIIPPNISSNLYRPSTPLYFSTSIPNCSTMSQFSLLPNFQWPGLGYGCFPVIANSTTAAGQLPQTTPCHSVLPAAAAVWRRLSPNKNPLDASAPQQKTFSPAGQVDALQGQQQQTRNQSATPEAANSKSLLTRLAPSLFKKTDAQVQSPPVAEKAVASSCSRQTPTRKTPSATPRKEIPEDQHCLPTSPQQQNLASDAKDSEAVVHCGDSSPGRVPSTDHRSEGIPSTGEHSAGESTSISLNFPRSIEIVSRSGSSEPKIAGSRTPVACPTPPCGGAVVLPQGDPPKTATGDSNPSRVSSPADSSDGSSSCPKVPPIKIVLSSKNSEVSSEKSIPVHRPNMPYIVNAPSTDVVMTTELPPTPTNVSPRDSCDTESAGSKTEPQTGLEETQDVAPVKKRKTKHGGCRTSSKDTDEKEGDTKINKESNNSTNTTPLPQSSDDVQSKPIDEGGVRHATERRVTRSTTANKQQQKPAAQKEQRAHAHHESTGCIEFAAKNDPSNAGATLRHETVEPASVTTSKDEEETQSGHPIGRKPKVKGQKAVHDPSGPSDSAVPVPPPQIFRKPTNPYEVYLNFKKKVAYRRSKLSTIYPKPPPKFCDYLMVKGTYRLDPSAGAGLREPPTMTPVPTSLPEALRKLFEEQERARADLRHQHLKERERLVITAEQETLRVHGWAARASANEGSVLSACAILCTEGPCYPPDCEQEDDRDSRSRYSGRHFHSWLQEISEKYSRLKTEVLSRHRHEVAILHGMQSLCWEWRMKELGLCDCHSTPSIDPSHVPAVLVDDQLNFNIT